MIDQEMLEAMKALLEPINTRLDKMETELFRVGAVLDNEVKPAIQLLAEGHENILEHLEQHIIEHTEPIEERLEALEIVTKRHSLEIAELKKAQ